MKKYLYTLLIASASLCAQTTSDLGTSVGSPKIILTSFSTEYPNITAKWSVNDDNLYLAEYRDEMTNMDRILLYDHNGNLIAVQSELHNDSYPVAIATYYIKNFPKEKYIVWSHYDENDHKTYFVNREMETIWFDRDGKYSQTVKKRSDLITKKS